MLERDLGGRPLILVEDEVDAERPVGELARPRDPRPSSSRMPVPPRTPQPPAFDTAAASSGPAPVPNPTEKTGASMPSRRQRGVVSMCALSARSGGPDGSLATIPRRVPRTLPALAVSSLVLVTTALALVFFVAPNDADQGFSQRIFYFHVSIAFTAYACFGLGAWKALLHLWKRARRPRELRRRPPGRDLRLARPAHRLDLGEDLVGALVALEREPARALPRAVPLLRRVLHAPLLGRPGPAAREPLRRLRALRGRSSRSASWRSGSRSSSSTRSCSRATGRQLRRLDPRHVPRLAGRDARARVHALPARALRQAARRAAARAAGGAA